MIDEHERVYASTIRALKRLAEWWDTRDSEIAERMRQEADEMEAELTRVIQGRCVMGQANQVV